MRKEYYNYIVKMPAVLHEMFRQKVYDNHFFRYENCNDSLNKFIYLYV